MVMITSHILAGGTTLGTRHFKGRLLVLLVVSNEVLTKKLNVLDLNASNLFRETRT